MVQEIDGQVVAGASAAVTALHHASQAPHVLLVRREQHTLYVPPSPRAA